MTARGADARQTEAEVAPSPAVPAVPVAEVEQWSFGFYSHHTVDSRSPHPSSRPPLNQCIEARIFGEHLLPQVYLKTPAFKEQ